MTRYVIDPPALLRIVADDVRLRPDDQLIAPNSIRSEALELLYAAVRRGELTEQVALARHERMTELKMRLLGDRVSRRTAWTIASREGWDSTRDAEYVALATLQGDALIALDPALAAKAEGIVPLASVRALTTTDEAP